MNRVQHKNPVRNTVSLGAVSQPKRELLIRDAEEKSAVWPRPVRVDIPGEMFIYEAGRLVEYQRHDDNVSRFIR